MPVAKQTPAHVRIGRDFLKKMLEERDPSLITLPVPLPSVPLLTPIINPIVQGKNQLVPPPLVPSVSSVPIPASSVPIPATSIPIVPSSVPQPPTYIPPPIGNGAGGGSKSGGSPNNNGPLVISSAVPSNPVGNGLPSSSSSSAGSSPSSSSSVQNHPNGSASSSSLVGGPASFVADLAASASSGTSSGINTPAGGNPASGVVYGFKSALATGAHSIPGLASTLTPNSDGSGAVGNMPPSNSGSSSASGASGSNGTSASSHNGISPGTIAGIVIACALISIGLLVLLIRKRYINRRREQRKQWWQRSNAYGDSDTAPNNRHWRSDGSPASSGSRGVSWRSSFGTTVDHAQTPRLTVDLVVPPIPPMAEVRGSATALVSPNPFSALEDSPILVSFDGAHLRSTTNNISDTSRLSVHSSNSVHSQNSDTYAQYLTVANSGFMEAGGIRTPMSVRPFSPSESFAFPKPPKESSDRSSTQSRPLSTMTQSTVTLSAPPLKSPAASRVLLPPTPASPSPVITVLPENNPFADPTFQPKFADVETVQRPFVPNLSDELLVVIGDKVKIIKVFDDGWALVQKMTSKGLIPIDCMRAVGQDLPAFLNEKRVSSAYLEVETGLAF